MTLPGFFKQGSFTVDPGTTPEMLREKRARLAALMPQYGKAKYVGEGVGQLLYGIGAGARTRKMDQYEKEQRAAASEVYSGALAPRSGPMSVLGVSQQGQQPTAQEQAPSADAEAIRAGLIARGLPDYVADGFVMNFQDESGLNPGINERNPTVAGSRGGFGLAQWTGPRRVALEEFAAQRGADVSDPNVQMDFLMTELQGPESRAAASIMGTADKGQAAAAIVNEFLRPAETHRAARVAEYTGGGGQDLTALRQAAANPWLTEAQRGTLNGMIESALGQQAAAEERYWKQQDPMYQAQLADLQKPDAQKPIEVGGVLLDPVTLEPIFDSRVPDAPEDFTLGEGQVRYSPDGKEIAKGQPKLPPDPTAVQEYNFYANQEQQAGRAPLSFNEWDLQGKKAGASSVTVGGEPNDGALRKKLSETEGESWGGYLEAGTTSAGTMQDMQLLDELITMAPQGPLTGRLAGAIPGVNSAADAFTSVVKRVAPTLRAPGSGATSDIEYDGMVKSLPQLSSKPEANAAISAMMKQKAKINMERGDVISQYQDGTLTASEARARLKEINSRSIMTPELKSILSGLAPVQDDDDAEYLKSLGLE